MNLTVYLEDEIKRDMDTFVEEFLSHHWNSMPMFQGFETVLSKRLPIVIPEMDISNIKSNEDEYTNSMAVAIEEQTNRWFNDEKLSLIMFNDLQWIMGNKNGKTNN